MSDLGLDALTVRAKTGCEAVTVGGVPMGVTVLDFWQWACSDLANNAMRGVLAEYLVGQALGCVSGQTRTEWDAYDLLTPEGRRVEVKSAAYLQSWSQTRLSAIAFDIRPTTGWDATTNTTAAERRRQAEIYVFCLLHHCHKPTVDPLDTDQWTFYVLPTARLDAELGTQKRLSLNGLKRLDPRVGTFIDLPALVALE
ncbi:hypothetical protein [Cryptosporangium minutisporangium]|uniref:Uncharacterized protein n=1 Tax=Cryptosporangium minutisporangium TaxID=113569 RepID=A0ABP6SQF9_9ACTN